MAEVDSLNSGSMNWLRMENGQLGKHIEASNLDYVAS